MPLTIDHLVYAVPDLTAAMKDIETAWGVRPVFGGQHATGTHNALLALGPTTYLEIIALDPAQHDPSHAYFGLTVPPAAPSLRTWAARTPDVQATVDQAVTAGYLPGTIRDGGRLRPDGVRISWRNTIWTDAWPPAGDGLVPFLIEWGAATPHPAGDAPGVSVGQLAGGTSYSRKGAGHAGRSGGGSSGGLWTDPSVGG